VNDECKREFSVNLPGPFVADRGYKHLVEGLDKLYADERNSKIEMQHGLWIVMNILSGIPDENLEMMIEAWRLKDAE
jgi:hypothetical protein